MYKQPLTVSAQRFANFTVTSRLRDTRCDVRKCWSDAAHLAHSLSGILTAENKIT